MNRARTWIYLIVLPALVAGWGPSLAAQSPMVPGISPAQLPQNMPPGYHQAADPRSVMMGQEFYDPTMMGWYQNYGDTCNGPRWYDFHIEAVYLKRDDSAGGAAITSDGIAGFGEPNVVLSTNDGAYDFEPGVRATGRYQLNAVHNIEATYMGALQWDDFQQARSNQNSLFSVFSQFGNLPFGGFEETDQATTHSIDLQSNMDSAEITIRSAWAAPTYRVHGSWFSGIRYISWDDQLVHRTHVQPHFDPINQVQRDEAEFRYDIETRNDLLGYQIGAELVFAITPGLLVGTEVKGGVYGNHAIQTAFLDSQSIAPGIHERSDSTDAALSAEGHLFVTYQFHALARLRLGYQVYTLDGLALAPENFNTQSPFSGTPRNVSISDNGSAFLHGGAAGLELGW